MREWVQILMKNCCVFNLKYFFSTKHKNLDYRATPEKGHGRWIDLEKKIQMILIRLSHFFINFFDSWEISVDHTIFFSSNLKLILKTAIFSRSFSISFKKRKNEIKKYFQSFLFIFTINFLKFSSFHRSLT